MFQFLSKLNRKVGIDLGSARTRIWVQDHGIVVDEPSLIAVNQNNQKVMAVGQQAQAMQGRVNDQIQVFAPLRYPKISDDSLTKGMLKVLLRQASQEVYFFSPTMLVALPSHTYPVTRQAIVKILTELGASEVWAVDQTLAAAIGSGVPTADASGTFILQLGASAVEAASISMSRIVNSFACSQAGIDMCRELKYWFKEHQQLKISLEIAQHVQQQLGQVKAGESQLLTVSGQDFQDESLRELQFEAQELEPIIMRYGDLYVDLVKKLMANASPTLVTDIADKGLLLSGGLAQLEFLEMYLINQLDLPAFCVDEPDLSVIHGVGAILDHLSEFKDSMWQA